jgi:hypothetical protein
MRKLTPSLWQSIFRSYPEVHFIGLKKANSIEPGNYSVEFYCDGTFVGNRKFVVGRPPSAPKSKEGYN